MRKPQVKASRKPYTKPFPKATTPEQRAVTREPKVLLWKKKVTRFRMTRVRKTLPTSSTR
jgi:hypothetical protein